MQAHRSLTVAPLIGAARVSKRSCHAVRRTSMVLGAREVEAFRATYARPKTSNASAGQ
jgi:hypothetical protein